MISIEVSDFLFKEVWRHYQRLVGNIMMLFEIGHPTLSYSILPSYHKLTGVLCERAVIHSHKTSSYGLYSV